MLYGTRSEHLALSSYQALSPQEVLREMGFALWGSDGAHDWLAASPDGLISSAGLSGLATITTSMAALSSSTAAAGAAAGGGEGSSSSSVGAAGVSEEVAAWVKQQTGALVVGPGCCWVHSQGAPYVTCRTCVVWCTRQSVDV